MRAREVNRRIERLGGYETRQRGSHKRFEAQGTRPDGTTFTVHTTVAQHGADDIPLGTLKSIEKDMAPVFGEGWLL